jgi:hypothetical protein
MATIDLCTTADVRTALELTSTDSDTLIGDLITAASRAILNRCQRELTPKTSDATRRFRVEGYRVELAPYDLRSATTVTLHPESDTPQTLTTDEGYSLQPVNGASLGGTFLSLLLAIDVSLESTYRYRFGHALLDIEGAWGCFDTADVPEELQRACIITVGSWLDRAVAAYGISMDDARDPRPDRASTWAIPAAAYRLLQPWDRMAL